MTHQAPNHLPARILRAVLVAVLITGLGLLPSTAGIAAPASAGFTYQGSLTNAGAPADGAYDFQFSLFDAPAGGTQIGTPITQSAVAVSGGLFTVQLDFGSAAFKGDGRWLEIGVRTNGAAGAFTILAPRQPLSATPYAITALTAWNQTGNVGTAPGTNFLGTTDNTALVVRTNNVEAVRVLPGSGSNSGNVGIGTTSPAFRLDVNGDINTSTRYNIAGTTVLQTPGTQNTFVGPRAGQAITTGSLNTGTGEETLRFNTTGNANTATGFGALGSNTTGDGNTATGLGVLGSNTTGSFNTANGNSALNRNTTGISNTATGDVSLMSNVTGNANTATGSGALLFNTAGDHNTANGSDALRNTTAAANTSIGFEALGGTTTGAGNTAVGFGAGGGSVGSPTNWDRANTTGSDNTFVGVNAGLGTSTQINNATAIGAGAAVSESNAMVLGASGTNVGIGTQTPQSTLQVASSGSGYGTYFQLPIVKSVSGPPASDCNTTTLAGDGPPGQQRRHDHALGLRGFGCLGPPLKAWME